LIQSIDRLQRRLAAATTTNATSTRTALIEPAIMPLLQPQDGSKPVTPPAIAGV
jgi:hypothetical protein